MTFVAGIDAGQSSTTAVIIDADEREVGRGVAGPADHVDQPPNSRRFADAGEGAVARALAAAHLDPATPLGAVVIGLSGYDGALRGAAPAFGAARVEILHDAPIALAGATGIRPAVVVIAGTGSVAYGEDGAGQAVRVGGHGYLFGDEGSSFALARAALAHAMAAEDRGGTSRLGDAALHYFERPSLRAVARAFYLREIDRPVLASFARLVFDAARLGDREAEALLDDAARALASLAAIALERLGAAGRATPVALAGGMFANAEMRRRTTVKLAEVAPAAVAVTPQHDPATGAARMALGLLQ